MKCRIEWFLYEYRPRPWLRKLHWLHRCILYALSKWASGCKCDECESDFNTGRSV